MKPKELLKLFNDLAAQADAKDKPFYDGLCLGAEEMYKATHKYFDKYRDANRDKLREYARNYYHDKHKIV